MCQLCRESNRISRENDTIKQILHKIIKIINPSKIILFGSYARGDVHKGSDVDLIIVGDFNEPFFNRIGKILDLNDTNLDIEPMVYTNEEFKKMVKEKRPFIMNVLDEGFVVYENIIDIADCGKK